MADEHEKPAEVETKRNGAIRKMLFTFLAFFIPILFIFATSPYILGFWQIKQENPKPPPVPFDQKISESDFENILVEELKSDIVQANTWRAARSDHRLIVHAILACRNMLNELVSMPPEIFSALLLDLTPSGSHVLQVTQAPSVSNSTAEQASALLPAALPNADA